MYQALFSAFGKFFHVVLIGVCCARACSCPHPEDGVMLRIPWHQDLDRLSADPMPPSMWDFYHMSLPQRLDHFCPLKRKEFSVLVKSCDTICLDV